MHAVLSVWEVKRQLVVISFLLQPCRLKSSNWGWSGLVSGVGVLLELEEDSLLINCQTRCFLKVFSQESANSEGACRDLHF